MRYASDLSQIQLDKPSILAIGVFDGVHRGHQFLISQLVETAQKCGCYAGLLSFHPHPDTVLQDVPKRYYLTTEAERSTLLQSLGLDFVVMHPFNPTVMRMPAQDFVNQLVTYLQIRTLWVGRDFALGYQREGNVAYLTEYGQQVGYTVVALDLVDQSGQVISATTIRQKLAEGEVEGANELLGYAYQLTGTVIHGYKRGRQIGFPTANIEVPPDKVVPRNGVYATRLQVGGRWYVAATNVGMNPTFGNDHLSVEAHILDFDQDIYGEQVQLTFESFLRPELKFNGLEALIGQLKQDVEQTRQLLTTR
ncbi:MAG: bifunctional riboflavin kinase/FAD synthetase [Phototrophicaceae bacterium]